MTLDERIEALTKSLRLMASRHAALEKETAAEFAATDARFAETRELFASTRQLINRLPHITEAPGQRLDRIEGQ